LSELIGRPAARDLPIPSLSARAWKDAGTDGANNVRVTARTVVKGTGRVNILRVAYQVNLLGS